MTDRELLELAAKAACIEVYRWDGDTAIAKDKIGSLSFGTFTWNPLTDDGDALRLAVKLNMDVTSDAFNGDTLVLCNSTVGSAFQPISEQHNQDPYVATRRAIVRAAAEIGKKMK